MFEMKIQTGAEHFKFGFDCAIRFALLFSVVIVGSAVLAGDVLTESFLEMRP